MLKKICNSCGRVLRQGEKCNCRHSKYDKFQRDKVKKGFYKSKMWRRLSEITKARANGLDEFLLSAGKIVKGDVAHHIFTLEERPDLKFSQENLIFVSSSTHNFIHGEYDKNFDSRREMQKKLLKIRQGER